MSQTVFVGLHGGNALQAMCNGYDSTTIAQWFIDSGITQASLTSVAASVRKKRDPENNAEQFKFCEISVIQMNTGRTDALQFLCELAGLEVPGPANIESQLRSVRAQIHTHTQTLNQLHEVEHQLTARVNDDPPDRVVGHAFKGER